MTTIKAKHHDVEKWTILFQLELVQLVVDGLDLLIKMEKKLAAGESIDDLMPAGAK